MGQSWRLLSRLPEIRSPVDGPFLTRVQAMTLEAFPNPAERSARQLVDFWIGRLVNGRMHAIRRQELIDFLRQNAGPDDSLDLTNGFPNGNWAQGNLSAHYTPVRLRAMVSLILMSPEFYQR
jgi:hypothetical protein